MSILFFIIAVGITGIACLFNLGNGYIDNATWGSLLFSLVTFAAWSLWSFIAIVKSHERKKTAGLVSVIYAVGIVGVLLYSIFGHQASVLGGFGIAGGVFFVLPFTGFARLFGGSPMTPFLAVIPFALLIVVTFVLLGYVEKNYKKADVQKKAKADAEKSEERAARKEEKKAAKRAAKREEAREKKAKKELKIEKDTLYDVDDDEEDVIRIIK